MNLHHNTYKGHKGFVSKYKNLGETKHMRIPLSISNQIKDMIILLENVSEEKGTDKVNMILERIINGLEESLRN